MCKFIRIISRRHHYFQERSLDNIAIPKITNFILSSDVAMNCLGASSFTDGGLINNVSLKHVYSSGQDTSDENVNIGQTMCKTGFGSRGVILDVF